MSFNTSRHRVINVGTLNPVNRYSLGTTALNRTEGERNLGVFVTTDLKVRKVCISTRSRDNRVLSFINRTVSNTNAEVIRKL